MRSMYLAVAACFVFMSGCAVAESGDQRSRVTKAIEDAILWQTDLDEDTWTPLEMAGFVNDAELFEKTGNFYKAKQELEVFGHPATYVGMMGVEFIPGPNATLTGTPESIANYITDHYGIIFEHEEKAFYCDLRKYIKLLVIPHPNMEGSTIIIGAYTGP